MAVDVTTRIDINRPVSEVYSFAADPTNAPTWYDNIDRAEWRTDAVLAVGSRVLFGARFLGRRLEYVYEIADLVPNQRLIMKTADGPFPMETTYTWHALDDRRTHMTLRNRGEPSGFSKIVGPLMVPAMRSGNRKDLLRLKQLLEANHR